MIPWKTMRETSKPVKGYTYECEAGHEWFIKHEDWAGRGENGCQECESERAAAEAESAAGRAEAELAAEYEELSHLRP